MNDDDDTSESRFITLAEAKMRWTDEERGVVRAPFLKRMFGLDKPQLDWPDVTDEDGRWVPVPGVLEPITGYRLLRRRPLRAALGEREGAGDAIETLIEVAVEEARTPDSSSARLSGPDPVRLNDHARSSEILPLHMIPPVIREPSPVEHRERPIVSASELVRHRSRGYDTDGPNPTPSADNDGGSRYSGGSSYCAPSSSTSSSDSGSSSSSSSSDGGSSSCD